MVIAGEASVLGRGCRGLKDRSAEGALSCLCRDEGHLGFWLGLQVYGIVDYISRISTGQ